MAGTVERSGREGRPDRWQRAVTAITAILATVTLIGLVVVVLAWHANPDEQPGNLINAVVAAANVAFVIFTWAVFKAGQDQLTLMRREAREQAVSWERDHEVARQELDYAKRSYLEAVKARLDLSAPRASVALTTSGIEVRDAGHPLPRLKGAEVLPEHYGYHLTVRLAWQITNWGKDLILVDYQIGDERERFWLDPSQPRLLHLDRTFTVAAWRELLGLDGTDASAAAYPIRLEVGVSSLGREVKDVHRWSADINPFVVDGDRIMHQDSLEPLDPVADVERTYPLLPSD